MLGLIVALPNPGVQKPEDSSPKHKIGSNITRLISICFSFNLPYSFWDLTFKWKLKFLPNHSSLETWASEMKKNKKKDLKNPVIPTGNPYTGEAAH